MKWLDALLNLFRADPWPDAKEFFGDELPCDSPCGQCTCMMRDEEEWPE